MIEELKKHLQSVGKTDESWLDLAKRFNILPNGTNKQRSDKVRKIFNSLDKRVEYAPDYMQTKEYLDKKAGEALQTGRINLSEYKNVVFGETVFHGINYTLNDGSTTFVPNNQIGGCEVSHDYGKINSPYNSNLNNVGISPMQKQKEWDEFRKWKESKAGIKTKVLPDPYLNGNPNNVLFIADIHEPFSKEGYLEHCRLQQEVFNCGTVIFAGDIVDNNFSSFHTIDPDGLSAGMELDQAIAKLQNWYKVFPKASVCLANHDRIIARKLFSAGVSSRWMKPLGEVFGVPNWKFVEQVIHNNILYVHGEGGTAIKKAQNELMSVCQGHLHTEGYVQLFNGGKNFAMQVGTGIDFEQYAFAYAQRGKKPILSCGVVMNYIAFLIPFIN